MPKPKPAPLTFYRWLRTQTRRNDRIGDVARDITADPACRRKQSYTALRRYLENLGAWDAALASLAAAQGEYQRASSQPPTGQ